MKKTTKLAALAVGLAALVGFTSCDPDFWKSFGKDDFYGTWQTFDLVKDSEGNYDVDNPKMYYKGSNNNYYRIIWNFDGTAENIGGGGNGNFRQRLYNYGTTEPKDLKTAKATNDTYWYGVYDVKGNSDYSKGKYLMDYQVGLNIYKAMGAGVKAVEKKDSEGKPVTDKKGNVVMTLSKGTTGTYSTAEANKIADVLDTWKIEDFINFFYDTDVNTSKELKSLKEDETLKTVSKNGLEYNPKSQNYCLVGVKYDSEQKKLLCREKTYLRFKLADGSGSGYTRMMITTRNTKVEPKEIGTVTNEWIESEETSFKVGTDTFTKNSKGQWTYTGTVWTGASTRCMARISSASNPETPTWKFSTKKTNVEYFNLDADENGNPKPDSEDPTDYSNYDSDVSEK